MKETVFLRNSCNSMALRVMLRKAEDYLKTRGIESPRRDLEYFLENVFSLSRSELYCLDALPYDRAKKDLFCHLIERRAARYPLQYCLRESTFMDFVFYVDECCLIPRPETEQLVGKALGVIDKKDAVSILDIGTGSANIAVSLARYLHSAEIVACDISSNALEVAKRNAVANGVEDRVKFVQSDLFESLERQEFDVIISNPPYVSCEEMTGLSAEVKHEPLRALCGGKDGLEIIRRLLKGAGKFLKPAGMLFLEIGFSQGQAVRKLCDDNGFSFCRVFKDYSGFDRIVQTERHG